MKILFLVYAPQDSFKAFCNDPKVGITWVDALLDEILKYKNISIALSVPVILWQETFLSPSPMTLWDLDRSAESFWITKSNRKEYIFKGVQTNNLFQYKCPDPQLYFPGNKYFQSGFNPNIWFTSVFFTDASTGYAAGADYGTGRQDEFYSCHR